MLFLPGIFFICNKYSKKGGKRRYFFGHRFPYDVAVDVEVGVNMPVPHAGHRRPWHSRRCGSRFRRNSSRRLAQNFDGGTSAKSSIRSSFRPLAIPAVDERASLHSYPTEAIFSRAALDRNADRVSSRAVSAAQSQTSRI
jgi:hypothetical protein